MKRLRFRTRLLVILSLFALIPAATLTLAWAIASWQALPLFSTGPAWDRVVESGRVAIGAVREGGVTPEQEEIIRLHERELEASATQARRLSFVAGRLAPALLVLSIVLLGLLWVAAAKVAGHLSRQLSRPIDQLVGWTALIEQGSHLPHEAPARGAPEFEVLRHRMRRMASELESGRRRALEAERLLAFKETSRRVAHELKNPLTPIRLAVAQLRRDAPRTNEDALVVLEEESARLGRMARTFAEFGRLDDGPRVQIDVAELLHSAASACIPPQLHTSFSLATDLPLIEGHHDALHRAVTNVMLNAVEACGPSGTIEVAARVHSTNGFPAVMVSVRDSGVGIDPGRLATIWEPYVTYKDGGTGLGLAITREAVLAHGGTVTAESERGNGTTVKLTLPILPSGPNGPAS